MLPLPFLVYLGFAPKRPQAHVDIRVDPTMTQLPSPSLSPTLSTRKTHHSVQLFITLTPAPHLDSSLHHLPSTSALDEISPSPTTSPPSSALWTPIGNASLDLFPSKVLSPSGDRDKVRVRKFINVKHPARPFVFTTTPSPRTTRDQVPMFAGFQTCLLYTSPSPRDRG